MSPPHPQTKSKRVAMLDIVCWNELGIRGDSNNVCTLAVSMLTGCDDLCLWSVADDGELCQCTQCVLE